DVDARDIDTLFIYDSLEELSWDGSALVLGIGVQDTEAIIHLISQLGGRDCAGLVVRAPIDVTPERSGAALRNEVPVLGFAQGASWMQLATILRSVLAHDAIGDGDDEMLGGIPSGDLFALANAAAALLDAPITIEDRNSRVLAFSGRQDEADAS